MTTTGDASLPSGAPGRSSTDERSYAAFRAHIGEALRGQTRELADRWEEQARAVALLDRSASGDPEGLGATGLVDALVAALATDADVAEEAVARGLAFGSGAFARQASLHHTMKALDLLLAMTMYACQTAAADLAQPGGAGHGLRLARQLQERAALLSLAATRGYTQAYADALRERFRHLRHDLRNPLGTIKNVLSLLDDDSVPLDARTNPSFRAMAKRNARSLEDLIADRLSDAAALLPVLVPQDVSLRAVACGVRRELRAEAERCGVTVLVGDAAPHGLVDAPALELLLRDVLLAALQESQPGDQLRLEFGDQSAERATILLSCESRRPPIAGPATLNRLGRLATQMGASVGADDLVRVSVPMRAVEAGPTGRQEPAPVERIPERSVVRERASLGDGDPRHDVRGAREREHGEPGAH